MAAAVAAPTSDIISNSNNDVEKTLTLQERSKLRVQELEASFEWFQEKTSQEYGRSFSPRPTDVFITTYPKCGTTWVSQICHQLRTGGHTDFEEITAVVPWDVHAKACGQNLDDDQVAEPRLFKSHESYDDIAKGGKYIHVCRHPEDTFLSYYRFLPGNHGLAPGEITCEDFLDAKVLFGADLWDFFVSYWEQRNNPNVLWIAYEDLRKDLPSQVRKIAKFMNIELTPELLETVLELSSFKWMEAHSRQFDEHFLIEKKGIVKSCEGVSKVRKGGGVSGEGKSVLTEDFKAVLQKRWDEQVLPKTGFADYSEMLTAIHALHEEQSAPKSESDEKPTLLRSLSRQQQGCDNNSNQQLPLAEKHPQQQQTATAPASAVAGDQ